MAVRRVATIAIAIACMVLLFAFVQYMPLPGNTHFWDSVFDTGHILIFGLVAIALLFMSRALFASWRLWFQYIGVVVLASFLGLALEIWQATVGRNSEWIDLFSDVIGIVSFSAVFAMFDQRWPKPRTGILKRKWLALTAILLIAVGFVPLIRMTGIYRNRTTIMPRLVDFSDGSWKHILYYTRSSDFSRVVPPDDWPADAVRPDRVAKLVSHPGKYAAFVMMDVYPDWRGYEFVELDVLLEAPVARDYIFRVNDRPHNREVTDRFRQTVTVRPGFQTFRFAIKDIESAPQGRKMDLSNMSNFTFYTSNLERDVTIYIGDVRLVH